MNKHELYDLAITKWGKDFQILMAIEEMSELTQEIRRSKMKELAELNKQLLGGDVYRKT